MENFTLHHLRVETAVARPLLLNEHKGSALRGALFHALRGPLRPAADGYTGFCVNKAAPSCWECPLFAACPVNTLVATLDETARGGRDVPRPYIIRAQPSKKVLYREGEAFVFDLALCADALRFFPYIVMALERLAHEGLGKRGPENDYQRGRLRIERVTAVHPLTGAGQEIRASSQSRTKLPDLPATHADVLALAQQWTAVHHGTAPVSYAFHFHTPLRLIEQGHTLKQPRFRPLFHRLITRLEELSGRFSDTPLQLDVPALLTLADEVALVRNQTQWVELESYSTRQGGSTPIGGLMGTAVYQAPDWQPFLPWLIWGSLVGVGKNTVKGDGWYTLQPV